MFLAIMVMSCARHDKLLYLNTEDFNVSNPLYTEYVLKPNDALYIRIVSADDAQTIYLSPLLKTGFTTYPKAIFIYLAT